MKTPLVSRVISVVILVERARFLRGAHFASIHVKLGHLPKVLGGCGEQELIISAAGAA